ncbi:MAG: AraC family transcriptional regulator [Bacillota bacterium]
MDSLTKMNEALKHLEKNLTDEIDFEKLAEIAVCSEYHFKRMFSFIAGITLSEYIRNRRLTLAALELQSNRQVKIIDLALKYGYSSPDSFTRAFKGFHGLTPTAARDKDQLLKAFPPMTFQLSVKGGELMNYRIVEKEGFNIVGIMKKVPIVFEGANSAIDAMWQSLDQKTIARLKQLSDIEPAGIISASTNFSEGRMEEEGKLDHYIGTATTKKCPDDLEKLEVSAGSWAVFEAVGPFPETLQNVWGRIYSEWFPGSEYELAEGPEILWNESKDTEAEEFRSEIWIPVKKR